jgi:hypothetical protein
MTAKMHNVDKWRQEIENVAALLNIELDWDNAPNPGDLYVANRNVEPVILTCRKVNLDKWWIEPQEEIAYIFDVHECVRIKST